MQQYNELSDKEYKDFSLRYSHNIIEHLGLKLYQNKPTNVIAELISNSWDADAANVWININDKYVSVFDDGKGMSDSELKYDYLVIGKRKRKRNELSKRTEKKRMVMGRKGIGKLAPFGIASKLSLITISKETEKCFWITLDLSQMLSDLDNDNINNLIEYKPTIICNGCSIDDIPFEKDNYGYVSNFLKYIEKNRHGTAIIMENLSLKKSIPVDLLKSSIGQRFTVTLLNKDFKVYVNDKVIEEKDALPEFHFRIPENGVEEQTINVNGQERKIRYWVGFVEKADWPQDQAGIGIYVHGKIAQDRPFAFGLKGREIWTRYMYGVIEADWLDELDEDIVSTDRTTINWNHDDTQEVYTWGQKLAAKWISDYQKFQKNNKKERIKLQIHNLPQELKVTQSEQEAISEIVCSMSPKVQNDKQLQEEVIHKLTSAWIHAPSQVIIKSLWERVKNTDDENEFLRIIDEINKYLVPESMSLSVIVAKRIFALTKLEELAKTGTEPQLQNLLEQFPWILGSDKGKVFANEKMKTIVKKAALDDELQAHGLTKEHLKEHPDSGTRPDFTVFSDTNDKTIILIELKSPLVELERTHYNQLITYKGWFQDYYPDADVCCYLIGKNAKEWQMKNTDKQINILSWQDICIRSRKDYIELLSSMLYGVSEFYDDVRIQKAIEFGGPESLELLKRMSDSKPELKELFERIERKSKKDSKNA